MGERLARGQGQVRCHYFRIRRGGGLAKHSLPGLLKRLLKRKGYDLLYEKMIVMPSNFATQAEEALNLSLLAILPHKAEQIITDILAGRRSVTVPKFQDRLLAKIGVLEHFGARIFGAFIQASQDCSGCGRCVQNCPEKNIRLINKRPKFGFRCLYCLNCIYHCPCRALSPGVMKFSVLKSGFDLEKMREKAAAGSVKLGCRPDRNFLWQGVLDYLYADQALDEGPPG